jgi:dipeptidyl aminopeptidase/acylaminoacyl peptidase
MATSTKPPTVVIYIHGGGWQGRDNQTNPKPFLDKGISVVAINDRDAADRRHGRQSRRLASILAIPSNQALLAPH